MNSDKRAITKQTGVCKWPIEEEYQENARFDVIMIKEVQ